MSENRGLRTHTLGRRRLARLGFYLHPLHVLSEGSVGVSHSLPGKKVHEHTPLPEDVLHSVLIHSFLV